METTKALLISNMLSEGMSKNLCPDKKFQKSPNAVYLGQDNDVDYPFKFVGGITYTLSYKKKGGVGGYPTYLGQSGGTSPMIGTTNPISFTPTETGNYRLALSDAGGISLNDITDIQVEQGSEATPYVPYGSLTKDFLETYLMTKLIGDC